MKKFCKYKIDYTREAAELLEKKEFQKATRHYDVMFEASNSQEGQIFQAQKR